MAQARGPGTGSSPSLWLPFGSWDGSALRRPTPSPSRPIPSPPASPLRSLQHPQGQQHPPVMASTLSHDLLGDDREDPPSRSGRALLGLCLAVVLLLVAGTGLLAWWVAPSAQVMPIPPLPSVASSSPTLFPSPLPPPAPPAPAPVATMTPARTTEPPVPRSSVSGALPSRRVSGATSPARTGGEGRTAPPSVRSPASPPASVLAPPSTAQPLPAPPPARTSSAAPTSSPAPGEFCARSAQDQTATSAAGVQLICEKTAADPYLRWRDVTTTSTTTAAPSTSATAPPSSSTTLPPPAQPSTGTATTTAAPTPPSSTSTSSAPASSGGTSAPGSSAGAAGQS